MSNDETTIRIFEKLDKQADLLHKIDKNVAELKKQYEFVQSKAVTLEKTSKENENRITILEKEVTLLKNNYKWWCLVFSAIGTFIGFLISNLKNILSFFR